jgi:general secretion pathway protein N
MMRHYRLVLVGGAAYLLFLLMLFPAATAWSWFAPQGLPLQLHGLSGSVWKGSSGQTTWKGQPIGSLHWDLQLLPLLLGKLGADFSVQTEQGYLQGEAKVPLTTGPIHLSDMTGQLPLAELMRFAPSMPIPVAVGGTVTLNISQLEFDPTTNTTNATGRANWQGAEVLSPQAFKMGNLQADISTDENGVLAAQLKDLGGPLQLDAILQLKPDQSYSLSGTVAAAKGAEASLQQALSWLGKADGAGKHRLNLNGRL